MLDRTCDKTAQIEHGTGPITDPARALEALRRSEQRWRSVFENSSIGIALATEDGQFIAANAAYEAITGYAQEELRNISYLDITHEDDRERNRLMAQDLLTGTKQQFQIEKRYRRKDGRVVWVSNNVSRVPATESGPAFLIALVKEIGERKQLQQQLERERDRFKLLLDLTSKLLSILDLPELCRAISSSIRKVMQCDYVGLNLPEPDTKLLRPQGFDFPSNQGSITEKILFPIEGTPSGYVFKTGKPRVFRAADLAQFDKAINPGLAAGLKSGCSLPLIHRGKTIGTLGLFSFAENEYCEDDVEFLMDLANRIAIAVGNALEFDAIAEAKKRLVEEKRYLESELRDEAGFEDIIGNSPMVKSLLKSVGIVATTDSTVLIHGETGTGKELVARAIHNLSARHSNSFVKINCAAIPLGLLESELFGHEKGAFTGAIARKTGRFELAHRGTIFLDEIGEVPLELQPKLLRVLQEQEFERLGSTHTIKVNARVIAATNRDLAQMVKEKQFRSDLFYRVNVFPIAVPPLRERVGDIPILARHFVVRYSRQMNRKIDSVPDEALSLLMRHSWPGNVRELQNIIERAVILSKDGVLALPQPDSDAAAVPPVSISSSSQFLEAMERSHILAVLRQTRWVIAGPNGAAAKLGLKRTTLRSRMDKLGISRADAADE